MEKFILSNTNPFISNQKYANTYSISTKHAVHLLLLLFFGGVTVLSFTRSTLIALSLPVNVIFILILRTAQRTGKTSPRCNKLKTSCELAGVQSRVYVLHQMTETKVSQVTRKWGGSGESWNPRGREGSSAHGLLGGTEGVVIKHCSRVEGYGGREWVGVHGGALTRLLGWHELIISPSLA